MAEQPNITDSEEWRDVPGWEGFYKISSHGRLRRLPRYVKTRFGAYALKMGGICKCPPHKGTGYPEAVLSDAPRIRRAGVHVLVCEAFHGPRPSPAHQVAHADGSRRNNHYANLRWATAKENAGDRAGHGTNSTGEKMWRTHLTEDDVRDIRARCQQGQYGSYTALAKEYGLTNDAIGRIVRRQNWKHI